MRFMIGVGLMMATATIAARAQEKSIPPDSAAVAAAYALIAPDFAAMPVRLDVRQEHDALVVRVTRADLAAEKTRRGRPVPNGLEARITRTATGEVAAVEVTGEVAPKAHVRLDVTASEAARQTALRGARYGPAKAAEVKVSAAARATRALGSGGTAGEPTLRWESMGTQVRPVWEVPLRIDQKAGTVGYVVRFDAVDGTLLGVAREAGR